MTEEFGFSVRPMTEAERLYAYTQSAQLRGQTGCIGFLRADMDTDGEGFFSSWNDFDRQRKTEVFKEDLDGVIRILRGKDSAVRFLKDRAALAAWCYSHPEARMDEGNSYGFRVDTGSYTYLMRLDPAKGAYNLYCYCYDRKLLDSHLKEAERGIRFITPDYQELFRIRDGEQIRISYRDGSAEDFICRYIDQTHLEVGGGSCNLFHICELAEHLDGIGAKAEPVRRPKTRVRSAAR